MDDEKLWECLKNIPGGYEYYGACSRQLCFPLKTGGELRFMQVDEDVDDPATGPPGSIKVDLYNGALPPGMYGYVNLTGPVKGT